VQPQGGRHLSPPPFLTQSGDPLRSLLPELGKALSLGGGKLTVVRFEHLACSAQPLANRNDQNTPSERFGAAADRGGSS